jgi:spermidine/putrescine transport system permease protein
MKKASKIYTALIMVFLFAPIAILLLFSFNESKSLSVFSGFSLKWYQELFRDGDTLESVKNTLILACAASAIATVMGTAASVGINKLRNKYIRASFDTVTNIPMTNPDIITGISLMLMFVFIGTRLGKSASLSFWTLLISHVTFNLPYVILSVSPKIQQLDKFLPEAAQDLGCTPLSSFFKVELPNILPGIISGFIMAFTLSLDDFVISLFNGGDVFKTLPVLIYSYTKKPVKPDIYALFTILVVVILLLLVLSNVVSRRGERKEKRAK